ncbi:RWD domain-containing protein 1-like [Littorina saxatilis]|uniref:RWD domain-containing protein n=1 Tax=Littorina saxatilis TaxID=31220 RepID=A0AAN9GH12_9CAEN|eukprot:GHVL01004247.1.p1 GENE.GHVL01004247.1~~GHVL01004247.1.p1  ORF type:complete len:247 (+),score=61.10 GHVL01004247.1:105-845(+)
MTDYAEEQRNEIEALESIYPDEIEILQDSPHYVFTMKVASQDSEDPIDPEHADETPEKVGCTVQFTYTPKYPDEAPLMEIVLTESLEDEQVEMIQEFLKEQAEENLGMVMVFTIISALQERLTVLVEDMKKHAEETRYQKLKKEEEAAQKKFEGTRVTIETFLAWKNKFDAERNEKKLREKEQDRLSKKPSGKELFMRDATLNDSDITFLQEEGDSVEVDESLFEDMEDLDLDDADDDEDDPDYVP